LIDDAEKFATGTVQANEIQENNTDLLVVENKTTDNQHIDERKL
jgi:hypothetical protein